MSEPWQLSGSRDVIDVIPDAGGYELTVGFDTVEELPFIRCPVAVDLDDDAAERFSRAWNEALLRRSRAKEGL